jgi:type I restriction enzyme S subunit
VCIAEEVPFELPEGWAWARFGAYLFNRDSERIPVSVANRRSLDKRYDYYGASGVIDKVDRYLFDKPLLLIGEDGANLAVRSTPIAFMARGKYWVNNHAHVLDAESECQLRYVEAYVNSIDVNPYLTGSAQPKLNQDRMNRILLPVPPLPEQRRIVAALDRRLSLVDTVERDGQELGSLFGRLRSKVLDLAIRGELTERDPSDEPAGELLARIHAEKLAMVGRGELKRKDVSGDTVIFTGSDGLRYEKPADGRGEAVCIEDEIPFEIPETWTWARLGLISNYGRASSVKPTDIDEEDWVLDLEDIESGTGRLLKRVVKEERDASSSKRHFDTGEVLYGKLRPYLNKVLISDAPGYCSTEIMPIALYGQTDPTYILLCLMSDYFVEYANHCSYGMNMPRLGTKDGQRALIPIPPISEQTRIVQGVKAIRTVITNL